jgi:hypothetical protein
MAAERRPLARALQVSDNTLGCDGGHAFVGLADAPAALEPQGEGYGAGEVARLG